MIPKTVDDCWKIASSEAERCQSMLNETMISVERIREAARLARLIRHGPTTSKQEASGLAGDESDGRVQSATDTMPPESPWLNVAHAVKYLSGAFAVKTLYKACNSGSIRHVKPNGGHILFKREWLDEWCMRGVREG
jgi:excisionase family DNA binding protein